MFSFQDLFQANAILAFVVVVVVAVPSQESLEPGHWGGEQTIGPAGGPAGRLAGREALTDVYSWLLAVKGRR